MALKQSVWDEVQSSYASCFARAKVAAALAELRSSQAPGVPGLTPLEAADQRVDA